MRISDSQHPNNLLPSPVSTSSLGSYARNISREIISRYGLRLREEIVSPQEMQRLLSQGPSMIPKTVFMLDNVFDVSRESPLTRIHMPQTTIVASALSPYGINGYFDSSEHLQKVASVHAISAHAKEVTFLAHIRLSNADMVREKKERKSI